MNGHVSTDSPKPEAPSRQSRNGVWLVLAVALAVLAAWASLKTGQTTRETAFMSGIFVLAAVLWVSEALPLFATSLLVIGLQILLLANPGGWSGLGFENGSSPSYREILGIAADPVLVLFFGGFVLAHAAVKEGVDRAMSALMLRPFGSEPRRVLPGVMVVTLMFSPWMSNTATTTMMLALVTPMLAALPPGEPFRKALVLAVPFTANIGGMGTPIASPPNAVAVGFLQKAGHTVGFLDWMLVAVPLMLLLAGFTWLLLWRLFPPVTPGLRVEFSGGTLTGRGRLVVGVFVVTVVLWMSERLHGLPPAVVSLLPVIVLAATGIFSRRDFAGVEWNILILIAGGISLGAGMQMTGLDRMVVGWLPSGDGNSLWLLTILMLATLAVGTFMSNTAAANLLLPIGISAATLAEAGEGLAVVQVAVSIALVSSMTMALPVSTPPNAIAYAKGEFSTGEMARSALLISGLAVALIILGGGFVMRFWGLLE